MHRVFLTRSLNTIKDPFSYFYLLAKIHKTPWATRPIVSCSGSILHGLGRWVDDRLQIICRHLPYALRSSTDLVTALAALGPLPATATMFTCDAVSMYTNIDTQHALNEIKTFLMTSPIPQQEGVDARALLAALHIIMEHNVFQFGDMHWIQLSGTAMGTPPAPMYATLYFAIYEARILPKYPELKFYRRYIDDGFGIWEPDPLLPPAQTLLRWGELQADFNQYGTHTGRLRWDFSLQQTTIDFLDLTIMISVGNPIDTRLYEKALNLYLYLPPASAHPPGVLKGLIYGGCCRIH